jgi:ABC-type uncharacterized transport system permease subunit
LAPEGFSGISVALLGMSHPIGIFLSGLFIAHLEVGGFNIQLYNFVPEVIDMIISVIIYFGAFALLFKQIISRLIFKPLDDTDKINIDGPVQSMISEADNIFVKDEAKDKTEQGED